LAIGNTADDGCNCPAPKLNVGCETVVVVAFIRSGRAPNEIVELLPNMPAALFACGIWKRLLLFSFGRKGNKCWTGAAALDVNVDVRELNWLLSKDADGKADGTEAGEKDDDDKGHDAVVHTQFAAELVAGELLLCTAVGVGAFGLAPGTKEKMEEVGAAVVVAAGVPKLTAEDVLVVAKIDRKPGAD